MALSELLLGIKAAVDELALALDAKEGEIKAESEKIGFDKGVASVPVPSEGGLFSQEEMDKYAQGKVDAALAAQVDPTPYSEEDMKAEFAKGVASVVIPVVDPTEEMKKLQDEIAVKDAKIVELGDKISAFDADLAAIESQDVKQIEDLRLKYKGV
jgi:hypothetical protein